ncbi:DMT family transporter [Massilia sp. Dwa41.01b]|uniref:DMT family transporter n=1 Tax=unclassified Massilia TaxID=2609279 RepID=UPI0015FFB7D1|nr:MULTISPECIES: DMT family transporter [unclassified Massilia]QNA90970.1 DMT family transporter [Massilia sp. Dwa41.01b]QNB01356.1 DMT family transporter [Massilia sp. Se16.2.3]
MLAAVAMFALMDTAMKLLSAHYPAMQVAALRSLSSLPLVCAWVAWRGRFGSMLRVRWSLQLLRAAVGIAMLALFAYGLKKLSLAEAYSIFFIAPALITALSVFVLKEKVNLARWMAIAVGMGGVLVVLRPEGEGMLTLGGLAILGSAVCYAISAIGARVLARSDSSEQIMFWLMLMMAVGATVLAAPEWVDLDPAHAWLLCGLAVSGFFGQLAITEAFSHGQASVVAPFEYSALAWGVAIDWLLWQTLPDGYTLLGAAIIVGSGLYLIRHEKSHSEAEHP